MNELLKEWMNELINSVKFLVSDSFYSLFNILIHYSIFFSYQLQDWLEWKMFLMEILNEMLGKAKHLDTEEMQFQPRACYGNQALFPTKSNHRVSYRLRFCHSLFSLPLFFYGDNNNNHEASLVVLVYKGQSIYQQTNLAKSSSYVIFILL